MKAKVTFTIILITLITNTYSQQTPVYSQYMFNKFLINPAIAGSEGYMAINLTAHEQWLGVKDAPKTHAISFQNRVSPQSFLNRLQPLRSRYAKPSRISKVGLGAYLYDDRRGLINQTGAQLTYAYHMDLDESQLSFGLTLSIMQYSINKDKIKLFESTDQLVDNSNLKALIPDFNFGVYYTTPEAYIGFSALQLMQSPLKLGNVDKESFKQGRTYNLMGGYRFAIDRDYSIEPSFLLKSTEQFNAQVDAGARLYYQNNYWGGLAYRTGGVISVNIGMRYDKFYFGYAFDYTMNALQSNSIGSHELMVSYKIGQSSRKYKWLERY